MTRASTWTNADGLIVGFGTNAIDFDSVGAVLSDSTGAVVTSGNVELTGAKYLDYANKPNHDDRAVVLVMRELNVKQREQRVATQAARATTTTIKQ